MIVYRDQATEVPVSTCLARIEISLLRLSRSTQMDHQSAVELLVEFGELESAIADHESRRKSPDESVLRLFRSMGLLTGRILLLSYEKRDSEITALVDVLRSGLERLRSFDLPKVLPIKVPEGYAYYGLYPESYLEAANRFFKQKKPKRAVVIGIRSIGTSLSSAVGAFLEDRGCSVAATTVRPTGHPFDRRLKMHGEDEARLQGEVDSFFLIVDEGPGMSGTSLTCVADKLCELGVSEHRVVFFPSWVPDGSHFVSSAAAKRWNRHEKYCVSFEDLWVSDAGRLKFMPEMEYVDFSGGAWRKALYPVDSMWPAVQPQHEKRKYLVSGHLCSLDMFNTGEKKPSPSGEAFLLKFAGLGKYGKKIHERACFLAEKGFGPPVHGLVNGFLIYEFVEGRPLSAADLDGELIRRAASYIAMMADVFQSGSETDQGSVESMILVNVREGLGESWLEKLKCNWPHLPHHERSVEIDGRMMPHEWMKTPSGILKMDGAEHSITHFMPGPTDISWELAGLSVEFGMDARLQSELLEAYRRMSPTTHTGLYARFRFQRIAYLAFRMGYTSMAASSLGGEPDGERFLRDCRRYSEALKGELSNLHKS